MNRILLLLEHKKNQRLLSQCLGMYYEILVPDAVAGTSLIAADSGKDTRREPVTVVNLANLVNEPFDLCILDGLALDRHWKWVQARKQDEQPVLLPFLLVTSRQDVGIVTRHLWQNVDELIITPIEKVELQARVEILLRSRQLSLQLQTANQQLEEQNQLKSHLVSTISHEFRHPLTAILGYAKMLERYFDECSQEKRQEIIERIAKAVKRLNNLIEDVLVISTLDLGKLKFNPHPLDLVHFCQVLVQEFQFSISDQHQIVFQTRCANSSQTLANSVLHQKIPPCVDENLLRHILTNLLSNAIKYSPAGGTVYFDLMLQDERAIFEIKDEGIGIPAQDQYRLFEAFQRASNVNKISGSGLGLSIVKQCVELHGGTINFSSEVRVGSTFTVTLPLHYQQADYAMN